MLVKNTLGIIIWNVNIQNFSLFEVLLFLYTRFKELTIMKYSKSTQDLWILQICKTLLTSRVIYHISLSPPSVRNRR